MQSPHLIEESLLVTFLVQWGNLKGAGVAFHVSREKALLGFVCSSVRGEGWVSQVRDATWGKPFILCRVPWLIWILEGGRNFPTSAV